MKSKIKFFKIIKSFLIFLVLFFFFNDSFVLAKARPLEVQYIPVPKGEVPTSTAFDLGKYFAYVFYFLIFVSGLIAVGVLISAGFTYLTSVGKPEAIKEAKDKIVHAFLGLLIIFGSGILLTTINPNILSLLTPLSIPLIPVSPSGVFLCAKDVPMRNYYDNIQEAEKLIKQAQKTSSENARSLIEQINNIKKQLEEWKKEIDANCYLVPGRGDLPDEWNGKITGDGGIVYFVPEKIIVRTKDSESEKFNHYGVALIDKGIPTSQKETLDVYQWAEMDKVNEGGVWYIEVEIGEVNAVLPYIVLDKNEIPDKRIVLFEEVNYNRGVEDKKTQEFNDVSNWKDLDFSPRSLKIDAENKTIVVLSKGESAGEGIVMNGYFFVQSEPNLLKYYWITNQRESCPLEERKRGGCPEAKQIAISYGQVY